MPDDELSWNRGRWHGAFVRSRSKRLSDLAEAKESGKSPGRCYRKFLLPWVCTKCIIPFLYLSLTLATHVVPSRDTADEDSARSYFRGTRRSRRVTHDIPSIAARYHWAFFISSDNYNRASLLLIENLVAKFAYRRHAFLNVRFARNGKRRSYNLNY